MFLLDLSTCILVLPCSYLAVHKRLGLGLSIVTVTITLSYRAVMAGLILS